MKQIVLASSSPRRKALLEQIELDFIVDPSTYDESSFFSDNPHTLVRTHARKKAEDVSKRHKDAIILGADSIVYLQGEILEKPKNKKHAKEMLEKLSNKPHEVITGICMIDTESKRKIIKSVTTKVYFKKLTKKEIEWYVKTGDPMDKAGAYGLQEKSTVFVRKIEGEYSNAVGLPLFTLFEEIKKFDIHLNIH